MGLLNVAPEGRPTAAQVRGLLNQALQLGPSTGGHTTAQIHPGYNAPTHVVRAPSKGKRAAAIAGAAVLAAGLLTAGWFGRDLFAESGSGANRGGELQTTFTYGEGGNIPVFDVYFNARHTCLKAPLADTNVIKSSDAVDCEKIAHGAEVFAEPESLKKPGKDEKAIGYPPDESLDRYAESACTVAFKSDQVTKGKQMNYRALVPSVKAWNDADAPARELYCVAWNADGSDMSLGSILPKTD
jgi:hypothetical protein